MPRNASKSSDRDCRTGESIRSRCALGTSKESSDRDGSCGRVLGCSERGPTTGEEALSQRSGPKGALTEDESETSNSANTVQVTRHFGNRAQTDSRVEHKVAHTAESVSAKDVSVMRPESQDFEQAVHRAARSARDDKVIRMRSLSYEQGDRDLLIHGSVRAVRPRRVSSQAPNRSATKGSTDGTGERDQTLGHADSPKVTFSEQIPHFTKRPTAFEAAIAQANQSARDDKKSKYPTYQKDGDVPIRTFGANSWSATREKKFKLRLQEDGVKIPAKRARRMVRLAYDQQRTQGIQRPSSYAFANAYYTGKAQRKQAVETKELEEAIEEVTFDAPVRDVLSIARKRRQQVSFRQRKKAVISENRREGMTYGFVDRGLAGSGGDGNR